MYNSQIPLQFLLENFFDLLYQMFVHVLYEGVVVLAIRTEVRVRESPHLPIFAPVIHHHRKKC
jgi:hypothetical protein